MPLVLDSQQIFTIMAAGAVGALAYTFCDSFWYSAVEGEVYGSSSFFTALVFWAILKWEHEAEKPEADRWIIFIFYMMGLSIGVHLLNLLTIPAIVMVYYFKRYTPTAWGSVFAFFIGCVITGLIQKFVIQYTIKGAAWFDILFVNSFSLPFFSGFAFFFILLSRHSRFWPALRDTEEILSVENRGLVYFFYADWLLHLFYDDDPLKCRSGRGYVQCRQSGEARRLPQPRPVWRLADCIWSGFYRPPRTC